MFARKHYGLYRSNSFKLIVVFFKQFPSLKYQYIYIIVMTMQQINQHLYSAYTSVEQRKHSAQVLINTVYFGELVNSISVSESEVKLKY